VTSLNLVLNLNIKHYIYESVLITQYTYYNFNHLISSQDFYQKPKCFSGLEFTNYVDYILIPLYIQLSQNTVFPLFV